MPSTIKLHRVLSAPPEKVFRAFTDPDAMAAITQLSRAIGRASYSRCGVVAFYGNHGWGANSLKLYFRE